MRVVSSLSIDRTGLSLPPLVLNNDPFDGPFTYPEDGLSEPTFAPRVTYAPDSQYIPGRLVLGSVIDAGTIPLTVTVEGISTADVKSRKIQFLTAISQIAYTVTITVDGVEVGTWAAMPGSVSWGFVDHGMAMDYRAVGVVTIPVNPPEAP